MALRQFIKSLVFPIVRCDDEEELVDPQQVLRVSKTIDSYLDYIEL
jgi:hypothetical protein